MNERTRDHDAPSAERESPLAGDRYAGVDTETGLLVYDTRTETAWIESDTSLALPEAR